MKYFLIAGEASGDLHASHLIRHLRLIDPQAQFRCYGGDLMEQAGARLLCHYRELAYMGFIPVITHLRTILRGLKRCQEAISEWQPDAVILVDYAGFNLKVARYVKHHGICPVLYYIPPKIWAWKERRIRQLRAYADRIYCILPFEKDYYRSRHQLDVSYVGNPTLDEVDSYLREHGPARPEPRTLAVLPGSRMQEVHDNLRIMLEAVAPLADEGWKIVVARTPSIPYDDYIYLLSISPLPSESIDVVNGDTYGLLAQAEAALVTSGTATLETALFRVPQVVCYYVRCGRLVSLLRRLFLKVPFISLVNLVTRQETVPELVAHQMTAPNVLAHLRPLLSDTPERARMQQGYDRMRELLGQPGTPERAAREMVEFLKK